MTENRERDVSVTLTQADLLALADRIDRGEPLSFVERVYICHELRLQGGDPRAIEIQKRKDRRLQQWLNALVDEATATLN